MALATALVARVAQGSASYGSSAFATGILLSNLYMPCSFRLVGHLFLSHVVLLAGHCAVWTSRLARVIDRLFIQILHTLDGKK